MSEPHLDFSQDHLPTAERHNEHASTDFDWEALLQKCDGELEVARKELTQDQFAILEERLVMILAFIFAGRDNGNKGWVLTVGRRAIAIGSILCPRFLDEDGQGRLAKAMEISKQAESDNRADAFKYLLTVAKESDRIRKTVRV
jgi:hypothetical protein